jgi:hypothetical protein
MKKIHLKIMAALMGLTILTMLPAFQSAAAQGIIQTTETTWTADFRDHITFSLNAASSAEITEVQLFYRVVGRPASSRNDASFTPGAAVEAEFVLDQTKPENYLPPGTELEYWWKIIDADGNELKTDKQTLLYLDNRHPWQTLENDRLTLYWYDGGEKFGQSLFDRANLAMDTLENDMGIGLENAIRIFIYANHSDLLGAISSSSQEWTGGQAFPDYGVVVIGVAPSQLNWGMDATTHEMTHLVIHQATDNPYSDLPRWLDEGIAVYNENQEELDDDFRGIFEQAVKDDKLMTLRTLSSPFPADPIKANLAYGQSGAVVKFIIDTYGSEAMEKLLTIFADGALYDEAMQEALGVDTDGLDNLFRESLGLMPLPGTELPAVEPEPEVVPETNLAESVTEPESQDEAEVVEEVPPAAEAEPQPANSERRGLGGLSCLAGLLPLMALGLVIRKK